MGYNHEKNGTSTINGDIPWVTFKTNSYLGPCGDQKIHPPVFKHGFSEHHPFLDDFPSWKPLI